MGRNDDAVRYGTDTFTVRVVGDDMAPKFSDGDFAYVDPDEPAVNGRFVGVQECESRETVVRLYVVEDGKRLLRAMRAEISDRVMTSDNETDIRGTVVAWGGGV